MRMESEDGKAAEVRNLIGRCKMAVRRETANRMTLYKKCETCGRQFITTAATPWLRQMPKDGKKQKSCYFCCSECYQASYKYKSCYDGKAKERRIERETSLEGKRKKAERWKRYYAKPENKERICARRRERYWENHEEARKDDMYYKNRRKKYGYKDLQTANCET